MSLSVLVQLGRLVRDDEPGMPGASALSLLSALSRDTRCRRNSLYPVAIYAMDGYDPRVKLAVVL